MLVFSVYIPLFISRVRPVHSFFEKKSILENSLQIFTNFFYAYLTPVSFGKWEEDGVNVKSRLIKLVLLPLWYGNKDIIRDTLS